MVGAAIAFWTFDHLLIYILATLSGGNNPTPTPNLWTLDPGP
jgi:hypothetical protein